MTSNVFHTLCNCFGFLKLTEPGPRPTDWLLLLVRSALRLLAAALSYVTVSRVLTPRGNRVAKGICYADAAAVLYPLEQIGCDGMHKYLALPRNACHATSDTGFRSQGARHVRVGCQLTEELTLEEEQSNDCLFRATLPSSRLGWLTSHTHYCIFQTLSW